MASRRPVSLGVACALALSAALAGGCASQRLRAASLPPELRADAGAGLQRVRLDGLATASVPSAAIGPEDLIEVRLVTGMAGESPIEHKARVALDGSVEAPLVGRVEVAGVEPAVAAERIASAAVARGVFVRPQVSVAVSEPATNRITVLGAVKEPGVQDLPRSGCDVLRAIAAAGGLSEDAGAVVELLRADSGALADAAPPGEVQQAAFNAPGPLRAAVRARSETIDLAHPEATPPERLRLADRDVIVVRPRQQRVVHVTGLVKTPNQFELMEEHDLRVLDAIAMAGGASSLVADKVLVLRQVPGRTEPAPIEVSIARAKRDGAENLILQSGDLVSVESTPTTTVYDAFATLFRVTFGIGGNLTAF